MKEPWAIEEQANSIVKFLKNQSKMTSMNHYVLGVSGGIDSALVLALAIKAVGVENVKCYSLPYAEGLKSTKDAQLLGQHFGVQVSQHPIKDMVDAFGVSDPYRLGNIMARVRMTFLYDKAMHHGSTLVLNTCNLSEDLVGYATKYGDAAGDVAPIAHLTKTEVYQMAEYMGIPDELINRVPSAELWDNQTDENELGFTYADLDKVIDIYRDKIVSYHKLYTIHNMYKWMDNYVGVLPVPLSVWLDIRNKNCNAQHKLHSIPNLLNEGK